jgi:hypothetical protein
MFYIFSFTKLKNRRAEQVLPRMGGGGSGGRREVAGKGVGE